MHEFQLGSPAAPTTASRDPLARRTPPPRPERVVRDEIDDEEDFGHTQIIPSIEEIDPLSALNIVPLRDPQPEPKKKKTSEREERESVSSQDLMDELESLIGKKVDELIQ